MHSELDGPEAPCSPRCESPTCRPRREGLRAMARVSTAPGSAPERSCAGTPPPLSDAAGTMDNRGRKSNTSFSSLRQSKPQTADRESAQQPLQGFKSIKQQLTGFWTTKKKPVQHHVDKVRPAVKQHGVADMGRRSAAVFPVAGFGSSLTGQHVVAAVMPPRPLPTDGPLLLRAAAAGARMHAHGCRMGIRCCTGRRSTRRVATRPSW